MAAVRLRRGRLRRDTCRILASTTTNTNCRPPKNFPWKACNLTDRVEAPPRLARPPMLRPAVPHPNSCFDKRLRPASPHIGNIQSRLMILLFASAVEAGICMVVMLDTVFDCAVSMWKHGDAILRTGRGQPGPCHVPGKEVALLGHHCFQAMFGAVIPCRIMRGLVFSCEVILER
jgi:hypothetical protein